MTEVLFVGNPEIAVYLRRNKRAKRLTLRVSSVDSIATLTMPPRFRLREAEAFLQRQEGWLRQRVDAAPDRTIVTIGSYIDLSGERLELTEHSKARAVLAPGQLYLPRSRPAGKTAQGFIKTRARQEVSRLVTHYSAKLGREFGRISLRDPRSRWGSCSAAGNLMFSWRLVLAPPKVLEYVVVHEVAHLAEMNHSPAFWRVVTGLMDDYQTHQKWLRENGATLHRLDFAESG